MQRKVLKKVKGKWVEVMQDCGPSRAAAKPSVAALFGRRRSIRARVF